MATIEPWLTNLLNKPKTSELPPLQLMPLGAAPGQSLSLPPLGPELAGEHRADRCAPTQAISLCAADDGRIGKPPAQVDDNGVLHTVSIRPLQLLLREPEPAPQGIPLRKIVHDVPKSPEGASTKKRHRALTAKEDLVQLPKLPKKQKSTQQVVPPIIAGLHEPPPDPAVFPPITSASFDDSETFGLGSWKDLGSSLEDRSAPSSAVDAEPANPPPKPKRRPMKPRRKWTEEETKNLLLGVSRHGVGRWTSILEDPDFQFNGRTAGDLKDRFRTCCPEELRMTAVDELTGHGEAAASAALEGTTRPKNGLHLEDILIPVGDGVTDHDGASPPAQHDTDAAPKRRRTRAHRKKLEDLAELGIHGPFEQSNRRKRRPFTKQDDEAILDGLKQYGPSWTRIQRDPRYGLSSRQPTDLRDRVRNKYPEIYANIEKANLLKEAAREAARGKASTLEPSVKLSTENLRGSVVLPSLEPQLSRSGSREDMLRRTATPSAYESTESLPALADIFDMTDSHGMSLLGAPPEMDLSHLILDDSHIGGERRLGQGR
ncbi:e6efe5ba-3b8b-4633-84de-001d9d062ba3 [Thermothielavioides terrestris]|jgi:hypothetical protein|uniref:Myb-like domain-containing protein n=2 Tax=Thermothielavioides terrestris TaxID=2587410 RepID=G2R3N5_THETT|nr:uncharacterized protein THITE_2111819 [Thermothielavioides terrestris NRRL 8126]AEO65135.1 hypothetical protein THITE_2111819 [Thermothielavioides terrestris NRRL 8126]SPQ19612.1 e6efe5ba-3b8b-4633-84de-001d9d062ba3 [Thermothielavioides terrestris]